MRHDPSQLNQSPEYFLELCARIGHGKLWISERVGISHRRMLYLAVGERVKNGVIIPVVLSYPEFFTLEALAADQRDA